MKPTVGQRCRQRGVGKLEFAIVVLLIGILAIALFERLAVVERDAERLEVDLTVRHIRIGLQLTIGERIMRGREDTTKELLDANPLDFLGRQPTSDHGYETSSSRGQWHFDYRNKILTYWPRQPEAFDGRTELRWALKAQNAKSMRVAGLRLEAIDEK